MWRSEDNLQAWLPVFHPACARRCAVHCNVPGLSCPVNFWRGSCSAFHPPFQASWHYTHPAYCIWLFCGCGTFELISAPLLSQFFCVLFVCFVFSYWGISLPQEFNKVTRSCFLSMVPAEQRSEKQMIERFKNNNRKTNNCMLDACKMIASGEMKALAICAF